MSTDDRSIQRPNVSLTGRASGLPVPTPQEEWQALGMAFDGMCKVGLALTVGFGVAATFCKLMESGKIKVPGGTINALTRQVLSANLPEDPPAPQT
ncbi:MAG TPA: hypothetical protein VGO93_18870 [Candidatus Xenobia bacterium]|jgi:hypothetical protein